MLDVVTEHGRQHGVPVQTQVIFAQDVTDAIIETAENISASAIVFTPRSTRWWRSLVPGEIASKLVRESHFPVIVLPPERNQPE
jgi:nucleotide-binding universal stress UspA family protein